MKMVQKYLMNQSNSENFFSIHRYSMEIGGSGPFFLKPGEQKEVEN